MDTSPPPAVTPRAIASFGALAWIAREVFSDPEAGLDLSAKGLKDLFRSVHRRDPVDAALATVLGGAYLFWLAEREDNPRCASFWDALVFIATSLSAAPREGFAQTDAGKIIASYVMSFGPALALRALEPPEPRERATEQESLAISRDIADKLGAILDELRAARSG